MVRQVFYCCRDISGRALWEYLGNHLSEMNRTISTLLWNRQRIYYMNFPKWSIYFCNNFSRWSDSRSTPKTVHQSVVLTLLLWGTHSADGFCWHTYADSWFGQAWNQIIRDWRIHYR
jgi:hypothetical protein